MKRGYCICFFFWIATFVLAQKKAPADIQKLLEKNTCWACHRIDQKLIGPSYQEIMDKKKYSAQHILSLIYKPVPANWPTYSPMVPMSQVPKSEAEKIAKWIASLHKVK